MPLKLINQINQYPRLLTTHLCSYGVSFLPEELLLISSCLTPSYFCLRTKSHVILGLLKIILNKNKFKHFSFLLKFRSSSSSNIGFPLYHEKSTDKVKVYSWPHSAKLSFANYSPFVVLFAINYKRQVSYGSERVVIFDPQIQQSNYY